MFIGLTRRVKYGNDSELFRDCKVIRIYTNKRESMLSIYNIQGESLTCTYIVTVVTRGQKNHFFLLIILWFRPVWRDTGFWKAVKNFNFQFHLANDLIKFNVFWIIYFFIKITNLSQLINLINILQFLGYYYHIQSAQLFTSDPIWFDE